MIEVRIAKADFDIGAESNRLIAEGVGGIATFVGIVRGGGGLVSLTLDHYPAMTERILLALADQAAVRWAVTAITIIHRVGTLYPGERIVFVGTASPHRAAALESCAYLIDRLKTDVPFWKCEAFSDGRTNWLEAHKDDATAAARWDYANGS